MARRATERLAVSTSTSKASRLRSTRSSVLQPIEPVDPRMESRRGWLAERGDVEATDAFEKVMSERALRSPEVQEGRSEEHTSELQSLMRISYAVFCLKKKKNNNHKTYTTK